MGFTWKGGEVMDWFRLTLTLSNHGHLPKNGEKLLNGFIAAHREVGPVVSQNTETGQISVTIALAAADISEAVKEAVEIFVDGFVKSGLPPSDSLDLNASQITEEEQAEVRELETA